MYVSDDTFLTISLRFYDVVVVCNTALYHMHNMESVSKLVQRAEIVQDVLCAMREYDAQRIRCDTLTYSSHFLP